MLFLGSLTLNAQQLDNIILYTGDTLRCNIIEMSNDEIKYRFPNEQMINVMNIFLMKEIVMASGRVIGYKVVPVLSESDWENVIVTDDERKAIGLKFIKSIKATSSVWRSLKESEGDKAYVELKKEAARNQCNVVVLFGDMTRSFNKWTGQNDIELRANIYRYPFVETLIDNWVEDVIKKPKGSYSRWGYEKYKDLDDAIKEITNTTPIVSVKSISSRIVTYGNAASECPEGEDKVEFTTAWNKLKKRFNNRISSFGIIIDE